MGAFDELNEEIIRGLSGKNEGISMGFPRMNKYVSIRKKIYTLVFGPSGSGKSAFVHSGFILNPFEWYMREGKKKGIKLKIPLFSMERSKLYTIAKWTSRKIFLTEGVEIQIGKMLGWWEQKLTKDEHDLILKYEDYINELLEVVDIIEGPQNPTGIHKYLKNFAEANGKTEELDAYHKVYIPNDENLMVIPIVDHMGLTRVERGMQKKEAIDKLSEYLQQARDFYGYSPVLVAQLNRNLSNPAFAKMDSFEPSIDEIKESGSPAEAADTILSVFDPLRFNTGDAGGYPVNKFIKQQTMGNYFRSIKLLKSTYSEDQIRFGMAFQGFSGSFAELPKLPEMGLFDYNKVFNGSYFTENQ